MESVEPGGLAVKKLKDQDLPYGPRAWFVVSLVLFSSAMAYLEAAVVVYLRALYYPQGFSFPLVLIDRQVFLVEIGREVSTLIMLTAVAWLSGRFFYERLAYFMVIFAIWDIFYYVWLKFMLDWPAGPLTWDILFFIPVPWIAPVLSPVLVSLALLVCSGLILHRLWSGGRFAPNLREWAISLGGALLIILSYTTDLEAGLGYGLPARYRWELLAVGLVSGFYALIRTLRRTGGAACEACPR